MNYKQLLSKKRASQAGRDSFLCFWQGDSDSNYVSDDLNLFAIDLRPLRNGLGRDLPVLVIGRILEDFDERRFPSCWIDFDEQVL